MEWRRAERFVSGSAPDGRGATRPFVDVQSVLCRTATFTVARLLNLKELLIDQQAAIDKTGSPCRRVRPRGRLARIAVTRRHLFTTVRRVQPEDTCCRPVDSA